jgi:hypothetical protein
MDLKISKENRMYGRIKFSVRIFRNKQKPEGKCEPRTGVGNPHIVKHAGLLQYVANHILKQRSCFQQQITELISRQN